jgi:Flp pilus assembly protein TadG
MDLRTMRRRLTGSGRERGQALAEFAIVSVILLTIFSTVLDLGRVFYAEITLQNAARAGALQGAITPDSFDTGACNEASNQIGCAVINESRDSLVTVTGSQIDVTCTDDSDTNQPCPTDPQLGWRTNVDVTGSFTLLTPVLQPLFGGSTISLRSSVEADQQYLPPPSTALPSGAATATPSVAPSSSPSPSSSPTPTASPTPSPSPVPCASGQAPVPDLTKSNDGSPEAVDDARDEWKVPGFSGTFDPANGSNNKTVTGQYSDPGHATVLVPGTCAPLTQSVYVTHS